jgi:NADPH:quinone reductase-like Zn-dependent oxidoreductase
MSRRVQFDHYGSPDVLRVVDVPRPSAGDGQVLVQVATAGINPGEIAIRNGAMEQMFPATARARRRGVATRSPPPQVGPSALADYEGNISHAAVPDVGQHGHPELHNPPAQMGGPRTAKRPPGK